jgi:tetratricopeptide (TPR) repeat protein
MRKVVIPFIVVLSLLSVVSASPKFYGSNLASPSEFEDPYQEADKLMTYGEDASRDRQSYSIAERGLSNDANNYQWLWRTARAAYFMGDSSNANDKLPYFERGISLGQRAIAQQSNAVEGHFWLGANYGGYSELKGAFKALSTVKLIRAEMETVLRLNDRYHEGNAYLALGEIDRQLPRLLGGNLQRAISRLEQGNRIAPANLEIKLALGQAYQEAGRKDEARRLYQEIVNRQVNPSRPKSETNIQGKARQLLTKL